MLPIFYSTEQPLSFKFHLNLVIFLLKIFHHFPTAFKTRNLNMPYHAYYDVIPVPSPLLPMLSALYFVLFFLLQPHTILLKNSCKAAMKAGLCKFLTQLLLDSTTMKDGNRQQPLAGFPYTHTLVMVIGNTG